MSGGVFGKGILPHRRRAGGALSRRDRHSTRLRRTSVPLSERCQLASEVEILEVKGSNLGVWVVFGEDRHLTREGGSGVDDGAIVQALENQSRH